MTTTTADYYDILGLTRDATLADLKKAYRRLARQHHPDHNHGDTQAAEKFRRITEAYEYLSAYLKQHANGSTRTGASAPSHGTGVGVPGEHSEAVSRILTVLEGTWAAIRARHPEIPPVVIIIASGTGGSREARWGHFDPHRWAVGGTGTLAEILISGEGLQRDARSVLGTLLHEAAHALAAARGIKDTSRQGRYHNRHYKALAEELGLVLDHDTTIGWSLTSVPDPTADAYARHLVKLHIAMTLWRHAEYTATRGGGTRTTNLIAAACPCGRSIRIAATTLAAAPVTCGACGGDFAPKEPH